MHKHKCRVCGHSWSHSDSSFANVQDHTCTSCGNVEWYKDNSRDFNEILAAKLRSAFRLGVDRRFPTAEEERQRLAGYNADCWNDFDEEAGVYPNSYYIDYLGDK